MIQQICFHVKDRFYDSTKSAKEEKSSAQPNCVASSCGFLCLRKHFLQYDTTTKLLLDMCAQTDAGFKCRDLCDDAT